MQMTSTTTVEIQRITEHLRSSTPAESVELPRNKRKCGSAPLEISNDKQEEPDVYLPEAENKSTIVHTRPEAVKILRATTTRGTNKRGLMMRVMIKKGWAPTSHNALGRLLKKSEMGELILNIPWSGRGHNGGGRRPYMDEKDLDELVGEWKRGEAHGIASVNDAIAQATNRRVERSGGVPIRSQHSVSKGTARH